MNFKIKSKSKYKIYFVEKRVTLRKWKSNVVLLPKIYMVMDYASPGQCIIHECCWNPSNSMHFMLGSLLPFLFGLSSIGFALIAHLFIYCFGKVNHILFFKQSIRQIKLEKTKDLVSPSKLINKPNNPDDFDPDLLQRELDSLKDILSGQFTLDTSIMSGLLSHDSDSLLSGM